MIGMMSLLPAPALHLRESGSRIVKPSFVVPENGPLFIRDPGQLTDVIGQGSKGLFAFSDGGTILNLCGDVVAEPDYVGRRAFIESQRLENQVKVSGTPIGTKSNLLFLEGNLTTSLSYSAETVEKTVLQQFGSALPHSAPRFGSSAEKL